MGKIAPLLIVRMGLVPVGGGGTLSLAAADAEPRQSLHFESSLLQNAFLRSGPLLYK